MAMICPGRFPRSANAVRLLIADHTRDAAEGSKLQFETQAFSGQLFHFGLAAQGDLPPILWTPDQAAWRSACSGVMYPMAE